MDSANGEVKVDLLLGSKCLRVVCHDEHLADIVRRYYAPALVDDAIAPDAVLEVEEDGTVALHSQDGFRSWRGSPDAQQLELALLDLIFELHPGSSVLHAGCVIFQGLPLVFVAPSGCGKSSMTRASVRAGASYLTDDLLIVDSSAAYGFARAIRFSEVSPKLNPLPPYLSDTELDGYGRGHSANMLTPIWWQSGPVVRSLSLPQERIAVVRLNRGADSVAPLTPIERLVTLHEAAIVTAQSGEYDGSLGTGPGFELSWQDPDRAFELLACELGFRR